MTNDRVKYYALIITTFIAILMIGWKVYNHFAKTEVVEDLAKSVKLAEEGLAIGIQDQRVLRQEGTVERAKNRLRFAKKQDRPTREEEEDVELAEKALNKAVKDREELIKKYESKRKNR